MSPEQARGEDIDARSDLFSLGGVFYFMLTGRKPFAATQLPALFRQIQTEDPCPIAANEAPAELASMVIKALAKNPDERHQSCQELAADLEKFRLTRPRSLEPFVVWSSRPTTSRAVETGVAAPAPENNAPGSPSTDDTVDLLPAAFFNPDDTVVMRGPDWTERVRLRVRSMLSSTRSRGRTRTRRTALPQPAARKR
jgi:serine/threonine protein kinase